RSGVLYYLRKLAQEVREMIIYNVTILNSDVNRVG
uniref:Transcriptional regulator n=1 Tax=Steinernema glaseri TaxID=37863 RepID=A0A1I8ATH4_9BILA